MKKHIAQTPSKPRWERIGDVLQDLVRLGVVNSTSFGELREKYVDKYSELVNNIVLKAEEMPGATDALNSVFYDVARKSYLNSANPQELLEEFVVAKKWDKYFDGIFGAPPGTKKENLGKIIEAEGGDPSEIIVVGDSLINDLEPAMLYGCKFVAVRGEFSSWKEKEDFPVIDDLTNLPEILKRT